MPLIAYARISTTDQNLELQLDALKEAGRRRIFEETASGAAKTRPQLNEALDFLRPGDTLVVWKLDRLARSLPALISIVELLNTKGCGFPDR